jgi:hypothetical protein
MVKCAKAPRQFRLQPRRASFQLVYLPTIVAPEVMMVCFTRNFVSGRFAGQLHRGKPFLFHHDFEISIYRGDAEIQYAPLCVRKNLFR